MKGKKASKETKEKKRQAKLKNPVRYWLGKKRLNLRKKNKSQWRKYRQQLFNRIEYKEWRMAVFKRDKYVCQICKIKSGKGKAIYLNAHHILEAKKNPSFMFDIKNGLTVCRKCHYKIHSKEL